MLNTRDGEGEDEVPIGSSFQSTSRLTTENMSSPSGKNRSNRTYPTASSNIKNLGKSPRVPGVEVGPAGVGGSRGSERDALPSSCQIMQLLSMAVVPEERKEFRRRFRTAMRDEVFVKREERPCGRDKSLCGRTPMTVVGRAFECMPVQLCSADGIFPESGSRSGFLNDFYIMDVILNRGPPRVGGVGVHVEGRKSAAAVPCDDVCPVSSCRADDLDDERDAFFRAAILFLPQCGVFYCSRDRHLGDAGLAGTFRAYDMSWLRLEKTDCGDNINYYTFGQNSYVKRFDTDRLSPDDCKLSLGHGLGMPYRRVSAWRISTGYLHPALQKRVIYRAVQTRDDELPSLAPDFVAGNDYRSVPHEYRAHDYRNRLETSRSAREGCRWYVTGAHHYDVPPSCLIIDPKLENFVDIWTEIDGIPCRYSVVSVRYVSSVSDGHDGDRENMLGAIQQHCQRFRCSNSSRGTVRANSSDVGWMIPIGSRITPERVDGGDDIVYTKIAYAANAYAEANTENGLQQVVADFAKIGITCFPQVHSVIRDTEQNSGLCPVQGMDGMCVHDGFWRRIDDGDESYDTDDDDDNGVDYWDHIVGDDDEGNDDDEGDNDGDVPEFDYVRRDDEDYFVVARKWAMEQAKLKAAHRSSIRRKL